MNLANRLTLLRILLVPVFLGLLIYYNPSRSSLYHYAVIVFILACATDAADGSIARRLRQQTMLGSYLDPVADKLLLWSGFLSLSFMSHLPVGIKIPAWVTIPVITRDVLILIGSTMIVLTTGKLKVEPLMIGKVTTLCQMLTLLLSLLSFPRPMQLTFFVLTVLLTIWSGIKYVKVGGLLVQPPSET